MNEIKCPNCGTIFTIKEEDYQNITKQIRDKEFQKEITIREEQYQKDKQNAIDLTKAETEKNYQELLNKKDLEISNLTSELKNKEEQTTNKLEKKYTEELNKKEIELNELKSQIKFQAKDNELSIKNALSEKEKEISTLTNKLELNQKEYLVKEKNLKENYEEKIKAKDEQISYYKDFKAKQSTKMIGESLEVHCSNEFNKLRPLFKNAYFEKDNDAKTGSKGDFIFKDYDDDGTEIVSIMFEMKNEADQTATKHKNEDFFKELDKDRKEKNVNTLS